MKIGAMEHSFRLPFEATCSKAAKLGISGLQISVNRGQFHVDDMTPEKIAKLKNTLSNYGMEITAFCGDMGGHGYMVREDNEEWKIAKSKRMVDLAEQLGVHVITTHIGVIPDDETNPRFQVLLDALTDIGEYAADHGVTFAIETGPERAPTLKKFLDMIPRGVGVNLDPANFVMVLGQDPVEAVKMLGKYIVHTHAKDGKNLRKIEDGTEVYGSPDPHKMHKTNFLRPIFREVPLGKGSVPWDAYIQALRDIGYDGYLTIEREVGLNPAKDIAKAVDFLFKYVPPLVYSVVGCGGIANGLHFPAIKRLRNVRIKYTCDIIIERAEKARDRYGIPGYTKAVLDYHEILADPEVDVVVVCTHTHLHAIIAREALLAGKNALSEKPVSMNYAEAYALAQAAHETGKISNIGVVCRFNSGVQKVKEVIESGAIGNVYHVFNTFRSFRRVPGIGGEFTTKSHSGGGVLNDLGIHNIDQILYILGNPKAQTASCCTYLEIAKDCDKYHSNKIVWKAAPNAEGQKPVCDVEEYATGLIRLDGCSINFSGAWAQNINHDEWFIDFLGDKGAIRLTYCGGFELFTDDGKAFHATRPHIKWENMGVAEHRVFRNSVLTGNHTRAYIDELLNTTLILDGLYRSAEQGAEVKLDEQVILGDELKA